MEISDDDYAAEMYANKRIMRQQYAEQLSAARETSPVQAQREMAQAGEWNASLFGCMGDVGLCCITWCLPCITFGQNAEKAGAGTCVTCGACYLCFPVCLGCFVRGKIRESQGIDGSAVGDVAMHCCCSCCALVQEAKQLENAVPVMAQPQPY